MTGEMIGNLLRPLIGKSGTIFMVVSKSGQIGFTTDHNQKLTGVEVREDGMVRLVPALGPETRLTQGALHHVRGGRDPGFLVAEQVDVLGGAVDDPVGDQGVAAAEGESVRSGGVQRDGGYLAVEFADRHQAALRGAAAAARRTGCLSSHACRTPLGRYRSGQRATSVSPSR